MIFNETLTRQFHLATIQIKEVIYFQSELKANHLVNVTQNENGALAEDVMWEYKSPVIVHEEQRPVIFEVINQGQFVYHVLKVNENAIYFKVNRTQVQLYYANKGIKNQIANDAMLVTYGDSIISSLKTIQVNVQVVFQT